MTSRSGKAAGCVAAPKGMVQNGIPKAAARGRNKRFGGGFPHCEVAEHRMEQAGERSFRAVFLRAPHLVDLVNERCSVKMLWTLRVVKGIFEQCLKKRN
ncbi:hypothetical protein QWZ10_02515 [Paracoccus cavernae]|uniref:Uncharacterized protein n=1 Tax=Paracoccus cavernae TaxID=1571207 RepID=A0ABT8D2V9_9RHOB|nr:hypothetical protein [Paracoccus cavernae]